jgi:PPK2 family polyphosphate:nucleotide phosphotransferase
MTDLNLDYPDWYRVAPDDFDLRGWKPRTKRSRHGVKMRREEAEALTAENIESLKALQFQMYAEHKRSVLIVLQALDTGGKDSTIRKCFGALNPAGVRVQSFKKPTEREGNHDFLWRIHQHTPHAGHIQIFNRSHYEDVLVVRVHDLVPEEKWRKRFGYIRAFEENLVDSGTLVVKFMLNISRAEQKERLQERLHDPSRHWKFDANDLKERKRWDDYTEAFQEALVETSTDFAPWYAIPADRKWYRNFVITTIVREILEKQPMSWPEAPEGLDGIVIPD